MRVGLFEGGGATEGFDTGAEVVELGVDEDAMATEENKPWHNLCLCARRREQEKQDQQRKSQKRRIGTNQLA